MTDDDLLVHASARILMIPTAADQVKLPPPPPAPVDEAPAVWRPADVNENTERIPLANGEDDRAAAATFAVWLGSTTLHAVIADSRPEFEDDEDEQPRLDDDESGEPQI